MGCEKKVKNKQWRRLNMTKEMEITDRGGGESAGGDRTTATAFHERGKEEKITRIYR